MSTPDESQLPLDIPITYAPRQGRQPLNRSGPHALLAQAQRRMVSLIILATGFFLILSLRLIDATLLQPAHTQQASLGPAQPGEKHPLRADILDRNGEVLATSLPTQSLYADPARLIDPVATARGLVETLPGLKYEETLDKLTSSRRFVWIKRNLSPDEVYNTNALGFPGLEFQEESTRLYPAGATATHITGFTNVDGQGMGGIERGLDARLSEGGQAVNLSIDLRLQHIMSREIEKAMREFSAIDGMGLIMDAWNGEILAAVSLPDYRPNDAASASDEARFNRFALGSYELGSVMKLLTTAAGLESGRMTLDSFYNAVDPLKFGRFTIKDFHAEHRWLSVAEVFTYSSNIGAARMALDMGPAFMHQFFCKLALCEPLKTELAESGDPMVPAEWKELNTATISFGHGIAITPLQFVRAGAATLTGHLVMPTFVRQDGATAPSGPEVVNTKAVDQIRRAMRANVLVGSGKQADVPGYLVGGKTGTAEKNQGRRYSAHANLSSFFAGFPMNNPRYVVFVMIDEPQGTKETYGFRTGGWTAAPAVGRIIAQMGPLYGIAPQSADDPAIKQALSLDIKTRATQRETF